MTPEDDHVTSTDWHPARPDIFDLSVAKLSFLYDEVIVVCV